MPNGEAPCDHAGKYETSMALALFPELVQMDRFRRELEGPADYAPRPNAWGFRSPTGMWRFGDDLREAASAELGEQAVAAIVDHLADRIRRQMPQGA